MQLCEGKKKKSIRLLVIVIPSYKVRLSATVKLGISRYYSFGLNSPEISFLSISEFLPSGGGGHLL